ncbi:GNAT family N-acetyltransferase [Kitasatospora viridis]|uniref:Acetyltransferase (GNAT) family protein n=1 Tax=Kitasatospora viridis TaxID=281105 RepID=A0A561T6Q4_9ACTN|nr:GNAT family N-acetyltransferase [Kitasatospora viridis]TWF82805.1 acetyltransferase (GNAT) family protein [Kitasatospora viridis]
MTHRWQDLDVTFHRADAARTHEVLSVLDEAAGWLAAKGVAQWPDRFRPEWVAEGIARGETWLASVGGESAATLTLDWSDPKWEDTATVRAGYLHRLAIRRRAAGLGAVLLDWAAGAAAERGAGSLRLDCVSDNPRLRAYYESRGFVHHGDVAVGGAPGEPVDTAGPRTWLSRYQLALPRG